MKWLAKLFKRHRVPKNVYMHEAARVLDTHARHAETLGFAILPQYLPLTSVRTDGGEIAIPLGPYCWTLKRAMAVARDNRVEGAPIGTAVVCRYFDLSFPFEAANYSNALSECEVERAAWGER